jgi:PAS domain S-box-containing protein
MAKKILIVDNNILEANEFKRVLELLDYEVPHIASSGEEAVKIVSNTSPDLILIDKKLNQNIEGVDAAARIRKLGIPVVFLISNPIKFDMNRIYSSDPYEYINKEFEKNDLKNTIELAFYKDNASKKLIASEEKYKRLAENSGDMIYIMTLPEGKYQYVNPAAEKITEYTLDEFYNSSRLLLNSIHPDYKDYYKKTWEQLLEGIIPPTYEYKIYTKSGKEKWLNQRNTLIKDNQGNPTAIEGIVTDITEYKNAEEALKKSEIEFHNENRKLLRALRVAEIGIWENDLDTNNLHWTDEMYKILGFKPGENIDLDKVLKIFPPEELERFQKAVNAAINDNFPYSLDYKIIRPDGKVRHIHDEGQVLRDIDGKAKTMLGTTQDVTHRKSIEKSLEDSEYKFRNLVETSPDIIWEIDNNGKITYISSQSEPILGYKPEQIIGRSILSFIAPEAVENVKELFKVHIQEFNSINTLEVQAFCQDGKEITLEIRSVMASGSKDNINGFQGIARDITEKAMSTNMLKTSINEKNILLQEIHHRVKNNMQIISSLLNLQINYLDDKQAIDLLKESQNRVRSMAIIHEKLYQSNDFTRINLAEYIKSLITGLFYSYSIKNRIKSIINVDEVELNIETSVPCGLILNELVSNSLKHGFPSDNSGEIYITIKTIGNKYEMLVGDNGIGFPKDIDYKKTETLGLQLVNNLVKQIDGEIELNNSDVTEFKIVFPEVKYKERI